MIRSLSLLLLLISSVSGCKLLQKSDAPPHEVRTPVTGTALTPERYTQDAVSILPDGTILSKDDNIAERWKQITTGIPPGKLNRASVVARENEYHYTITTLLTADDRRYVELVVWDQRGGIPRRALEFIAPYEAHSFHLEEINAARIRWMEYCNAHEVAQLIENCYTENTLYYNHRPLLQGREALVAEYAYMKNPEYQLTLTPIYVEEVSDTLALEVGQCSGSYGGKYFLVWKKQEYGVWQVFLDGNL
jgi:ketosteroid isomerase-like protein